MSGYLLTDADREQHVRLTAIANTMDATTYEMFAMRPVAEGMACAEVGAGVGTVAEWLCEQVGPQGRVVATDIEPKWLELLARPNLEVRQHDITEGALEGTFDRVHVRNLLVHLDAARALTNLAASLRPGGWLLVEEADMGTVHFVHPEGGPLERYWRAATTAIAGAGGDPYLGRKLPLLMADAGLTEIEVVATIRTRWNDDAYMVLFEHLSQVLLQHGLVSAEDVDAIAALPRSDDRFWMGPLSMSVWGRRAG